MDQKRVGKDDYRIGRVSYLRTRIGRVWYHPLARANKKVTAKKKAEQYRKAGYRARVDKGARWYYVYVSETKKRKRR